MKNGKAAFGGPRAARNRMSERKHKHLAEGWCELEKTLVAYNIKRLTELAGES